MMSRPELLPRLTLTAVAVLLAIWLAIAALPGSAGVDSQAPAPRVTVDVSGSF